MKIHEDVVQHSGFGYQHGTTTGQKRCNATMFSEQIEIQWVKICQVVLKFNERKKMKCKGKSMA